MVIKEALEEAGSKATFVATTEQPRTALELYEKGVDYVVIPHHLGGDYVAHLLEEYKTDKRRYDKEGRKHKRELKKANEGSKYN